MRRAELYAYLPAPLRVGHYDELIITLAPRGLPWLDVPDATTLTISSLGNMQHGLGLRCPQTTTLTLEHFVYLQAIMAPPGGLARVCTLSLDECPVLVMTAIGQLVRVCPRLRELRMRNPGGGSRMALVLRHAALRRLEVHWDRDHPVYLRTVDLGGCPCLTSLSIIAPKRTMFWWSERRASARRWSAWCGITTTSAQN